MNTLARPLLELAEQRNARFGTSGVRGLVSDLSGEVCHAYALALLKALGGNAQQVAVGHDLRPSSPRIIGTGRQIYFDRSGIKFYCADGAMSKADEDVILRAEVRCHEVLASLIPLGVNEHRGR